jgi:SAM-dependent methyltransferase
MKLAFACPFYGPTNPLVGDSQRANVMNAAAAGHEWVDDYSTSGLQHRGACESIAERAAKDDRIDYVFWTEHDVILPPDAIETLIKALDATPEADVVTGLVFRRCPPYNPMVCFHDDTLTREDYEALKIHHAPQVRKVANEMSFEEMSKKKLRTLTSIEPREPFEVATASMGCLLFRRSVFERLAGIPDLFAVDPLGHFSIDNTFFLRAGEAGIRLFCVSKILCGHLSDPEIIGWEYWQRFMMGLLNKDATHRVEKLREAFSGARIYGELTRLADKYGSDKGTIEHRYTDFYESMLAPMRVSAERVLEIGVFKGASLRVWRDYFPNATVYGMDLKDCSAEVAGEERIVTDVADQANREDLRRFVSGRPGQFDLIVDDGGHSMEQQQVSLGTLFPYLRPGGVYILEDLHTSFMGSSWGVSEDGSNATMFLLEALAEGKTYASPFLTPEESSYLAQNVDSCVIYGKQSLTSVIRKKA